VRHYLVAARARVSVLVIGGDDISSVAACMHDVGVKEVLHWDLRKKLSVKRALPHAIDAVFMLTTYLNHNAMKHFKSECKKRKVPVYYCKHALADVQCMVNRFSCEQCGGCSKQ